MARFILSNPLLSINDVISPKTFPIFGNVILIWIQVFSAQTSSNDEDLTLTTCVNVLLLVHWMSLWAETT